MLNGHLGQYQVSSVHFDWSLVYNLNKTFSFCLGSFLISRYRAGMGNRWSVSCMEFFNPLLCWLWIFLRNVWNVGVPPFLSFGFIRIRKSTWLKPRISPRQLGLFSRSHEMPDVKSRTLDILKCQWLQGFIPCTLSPSRWEGGVGKSWSWTGSAGSR